MQVVLNSISKEAAEAVRAALEPDNVDFPEGLSLSVESIDNGLILEFEDGKEMGRLIGTVDEVLEHVQVALRVIG